LLLSLKKAQAQFARNVDLNLLAQTSSWQRIVHSAHTGKTRNQPWLFASYCGTLPSTIAVRVILEIPSALFLVLQFRGLGDCSFYAKVATLSSNK
jgi:hypothetical protein